MSNKLIKSGNNRMLSKSEKYVVDQVVFSLNVGIEEVVVRLLSGELAFFKVVDGKLLSGFFENCGVTSEKAKKKLCLIMDEVCRILGLDRM